MKIENKIEKFLNEDELKVGDNVKIEKSYRTVVIDGPEWKKKIDSLRDKIGKVTSIDKYGMAQVKFGSDDIRIHKGHIKKV